MGSGALHQLAADGVEAVGIEQHDVGHTLGSSHGRSRVFRLAYPDPFYVELAKAALPLWRELEERSGRSLYTRCGMLVYAREGSEAFGRMAEALEGTSTPHELLDPGEVTDRFPRLAVGDGDVACFTPEAGFVDASGTVTTQVEQARSAGARVLDRTPIDGIDVTGERPVVGVSGESFRCRRLVVCPGPWAPDVLADLGIPITVTRQQKLYFSVADPERSGPDHVPVYADLDRLRYGFPFWGPGVKVADDRPGPAVTPETIDRELDPDGIELMAGWVRELMPSSEPVLVEGGTCMYSLTDDRDFVVGPHPANPAVIVACGFSGHGFKFTPLIGRILADLATDGRTGYPIDRFRPDR